MKSHDIGKNHIFRRNEPDFLVGYATKLIHSVPSNNIKVLKSEFMVALGAGPNNLILATTTYPS